MTSGVRFVAVALTTTAIGTLLPILGDAGILDTKLGTNILASGAIGEIGPIIAISLALTSDRPGRTTVVLLAFAGIAAITMWLATRPARTRTVELISRTLHSSGQLGVRICVLLCVLLVWTAAEFDLDVLLGAFAAGMVARLFLVGHAATPVEGAPAAHDHRKEVQERLEAVGYGFFIPLFFVVSGVRFDLDALLDPIELVKVPMFLGLFLVVRGLPALLYRADLQRDDVVALGLLQAAGLPLIVVITGLGVEAGQMSSENAAGLVGAGLLSVVILPMIALSVQRGAAADRHRRRRDRPRVFERGHVDTVFGPVHRRWARTCDVRCTCDRQRPRRGAGRRASCSVRPAAARRRTRCGAPGRRDRSSAPAARSCPS